MDKTIFRAYRESGMTLIEILAALAIAAVVVVGALALYQSGSASNDATTMLQDVTAIRASTQELYDGQGGYGTGSLNSVLYTAGKIPSDMTYSGGTITTRLGGTLSVTGNTSNFSVSITNVPSDICSQLLAESSDGWQSVAVNGGTPLTAFPISPATATSPTYCGATSPLTLTWTSID